ncbi:hypothetical protein SAMN05421823_102556 [Catalinimonas alkaloidigena]|uniref:Uncharacterized protein n=1 Tax=Catalinimonas alkaloidigena TaxID=1075417 RepID=A0A1G9B9B9_9BACT|nr:hypothetical protein [Catalinimonas alkaloidigena]SDK36162.1 hypothetical protein SAMN05421823_102556 [Catalinimonas alkaloidigena]
MSDRDQAKAEIEMNRSIIFNTQQGYYTVGPFQVSPENRKAVWGDASAEDFEIRLYPHLIRWFTLENRQFATSQPARLVRYCNSLSTLLLHNGQNDALTDEQLKELYQVHAKLLEAKIWAGKLYLEAWEEIEKDSA